MRSETRFAIGGTAASEGVVRRLAAILETRANWELFRALVRSWSQKHVAQGWGIMICLAEDCLVARPEPAQQAQLPFNVRSIADAKRMPGPRNPPVEAKVRTAIDAQTRWRVK